MQASEQTNKQANKALCILLPLLINSNNIVYAFAVTCQQRQVGFFRAACKFAFAFLVGFC